MPGSTLHGYPYAQPSDPRVDWPATSLALATALENNLRIATGSSGGIAAIAPGASTTVNVTFPAGLFTAGAPTLMAISNTSRLTMGVSAITAVGATIALSNWTSAGSPPGSALFWIAIGK